MLNNLIKTIEKKTAQASKIKDQYLLFETKVCIYKAFLKSNSQDLKKFLWLHRIRHIMDTVGLKGYMSMELKEMQTLVY